MLTSYFSKVYCNSTRTNFRNYSLNDKIINSTFSFNKLKITEIDEFNLTSSLPLISSRYSRPDGILPIFLYNLRLILTPISTNIFKTSLEFWKTSFVSPVFKKGESSSFPNYRPISKLSPNYFLI